MITEYAVLFLVIGALASAVMILVSGRGGRESYRSEKNYLNPIAALTGEMDYGGSLD